MNYKILLQKEEVKTADLVAFVFPPIIGLLYYFINYGFAHNSIVDVVKMVGLAYTLLLLPPFLNTVRIARKKSVISISSLTLFLLLGLSFVGFLCVVFSFNVSYIIILAGFCLAVLFLRNTFKQVTAKKIIVYTLLFSAFSFTVCDLFWCRGFHNPLFFARIGILDNHSDLYYHCTFANMIKTYNIPSFGVDGVWYKNYHWGTHLIFAYLSGAVNVPVYTFFNLFYPGICFSLFIKFIFSLIQSLSKNHTNKFRVSLTCFFILYLSFIIVFPYFGATPSRTLLFSESQLFSIVVSLLFFSYTVELVQSGKLAAVPSLANFGMFILFFVAIGLLKISSLLIVVVCIGYLFLRFNLIRKVRAILFLLILLGISAALYKTTVSSLSSDGGFNTLQDLLATFHRHKSTLILLVGYSFIIAMYFLFHAKLTKRIQQIMPAEILLTFELFLITSAATLFLFFAMNLDNITYFFNFVFWILVIGLLSFMSYFLHERKMRPFSINPKLMMGVYLGFILLVTLYFTLTHTQRLISYNLNIRKKIISLDSSATNTSDLLYKPQQVLLKQPFYILISKLDSLSALPRDEKQKTCIYIPKTDSVFWFRNGIGYREAPLIVQTLSEMAALQGYAVHGIDFYYMNSALLHKRLSNNNLSDALLRKLAGMYGFKNVIHISHQNKKLVVRRINCL